MVIDVDKRPGTPTAGGGGTIYYGFRSFRTPTSNDPPTMFVVTSRDFGETFEKPIAMKTTPTFPFDQPSIGTDFDATGARLAFRTNAFLTIQSVPIASDRPALRGVGGATSGLRRRESEWRSEDRLQLVRQQWSDVGCQAGA